MQHRLTIETTRQKQVKDITEEIQNLVTREKIKDGVAHVFILHTTAAITTTDLDPGTDLDMLDAFEKIVPKLPYRHAHNPEHAPDHIMSSIIGPSVTIPVEDGELQLGTWQKVVVVELDGPRDRSVIVTIMKL